MVNRMSEKTQHKSSIGGQALIEGLMMRGPEISSMVVRLPDGEMDIETWQTNKKKKTPWYKKTPIIRGSFNFIDTMLMGYKCLMKSAEKSGLDLEEPTAFEKKLQKLFGDNLMKVVSAVAMVLAVGLAALLFMVLPAAISQWVTPYVQYPWVRALIEGLIKIVIFVLYVAAVSRMPDIKRVFEYHGAEHKTIACYEAGLPFTVENVQAQSRFHPRCGTSFVLIVLVVSILVFSVVTWNSLVIRVLLKFALLPVVVGIAYEIIKLAGRYDNALTRIISAPGLWLQRLTTNEPDESQIECAIAAMEPCIPEDKHNDLW